MKLLIASAMALVSTGAGAATYAFDLSDPFTHAAAGSGTLSFADQSVAQATSNGNGRAVYRHASFELTLARSGLPALRWTTGMVTVSYNVQTPVGTAPDSISAVADDGAQHAYGDFSFNAAGDAFSSGDFGNANFASVAAHFASGRLQVGSPAALYALSNVRVLAAPVPEPGEWAMIGGGLAVTGGVARRRARRRGRT